MVKVLGVGAALVSCTCLLKQDFHHSCTASVASHWSSGGPSTAMRTSWSSPSSPSRLRLSVLISFKEEKTLSKRQFAIGKQNRSSTKDRI